MAQNADNNGLNKEDEVKSVASTNAPQALSGSQQGAVGGQRVSNYSSGTPVGQQGSGRFTNLSKYIGANAGAGDQIGARIGDTFNSKLGQQTNEISEKNQKIAANIESGNKVINEEGTGFKQELGNIGQGLNKFNSMIDRAGFDEAAKQAQGFATSPKFSRFQTIQSGQAIDDNSLNQSQADALASGNNLNKFTQDRLNKINSEQGRYDLMRDTYGNKQNYSSGNARFDQLFLQNSPTNVVGNLTNQFNQGNLNAAKQLENINLQGNNINDLLTKESGLVGDLNKQAKSNQDLFNSQLGNQKNIDYIQSLRDAKYNEYLNQLKTGNITSQVAGDMGLNDLFTYEPGGLGIDPSRVSYKMGAQPALATQPKSYTPLSIDDIKSGSTGANGSPELWEKLNNTQYDITNAQQSNPTRALRMYNTDLANTAGSYLQQGKIANSMQDIATQNDYDAYKALQAISGLDTGKLIGASTINPAVMAKKDSSGMTLAERIGSQDKAFRDTYAGKHINALASATESGSGAMFDPGSSEGGSGANSINSGKAFIGDKDVSSYNDFMNNVISNNSKSRGSGATGFASASVDDAIRNGLGGIVAGGAKAWDRGGDTNSNIAAYNQATGSARNAVSDYLNNLINQTGVKNTGTIGLDDTNNEVLKNARRFSGLV
jgi:hypothetical protein